MPEKYKQNLIKAHEKCSNIIRSSGFSPEPLETALSVEEHRWFWKPKDVKFLLIAESHVYTHKNEVEVRIDLRKMPAETPKDVPVDFVRLVYCLGYGEPAILERSSFIENNRGTKQYLNLLRRCAAICEKPKDSGWLEWKVKILGTVKEKGIWLLDASVHACYKGKGERLPPRLVREMIPVSWTEYVKPIIDDISIDGNCIWVVGKDLHDTLYSKCGWRSNWMYQPNAHFKHAEKYEEKRQRELDLARAVQGCCC